MAKSRNSIIGSSTRVFPQIDEQLVMISEHRNPKSLTQIPVYGLTSIIVDDVRKDRNNSNVAIINDEKIRMNVSTIQEVDKDNLIKNVGNWFRESHTNDLREICIALNDKIKDECLKYADNIEEVNNHHENLDSENPDVEGISEKVSVILKIN